MSENLEEYIVGRNPVREALNSGREINKAWILENKGEKRDARLSDLEQELKDRGVLVYYSPRSALDKISPTAAHQGVIIQVAARSYADSRKLIEQLREEGKPGFILILDELQDGHNLGACLRIADAAAVDLVVIPERRSAVLDQFVAKASAGAVEYVPVAREVNLSRFIADLKEAGYWIYASAGEAEDNYTEQDFKGNIAIIIGNEGKGISQKIKENSDFLIKIPMYGKINSLNASVACGVLCFEAARQRHA